MFVVMCDKCKKFETVSGDMSDPDGALDCECCPEDHNHAGLGCRPITITATRGSVTLQASS